jgi:hypothetical protein
MSCPFSPRTSPSAVRSADHRVTARQDPRSREETAFRPVRRCLARHPDTAGPSCSSRLLRRWPGLSPGCQRFIPSGLGLSSAAGGAASNCQQQVVLALHRRPDRAQAGDPTFALTITGTHPSRPSSSNQPLGLALFQSTRSLCGAAACPKSVRFPPPTLAAWISQSSRS